MEGAIGQLLARGQGLLSVDLGVALVASPERVAKLIGVVERAMQTMRMQTDRPTALREATIACRNGGTVSVAGVYSGFIDKFPMGAFVNKALTLKSGQTHVQRYLRRLLDRIESGEIDPSFVVTHTMALEDAPHG
jgi:threonine dehydrogenase-like Zn-dependent dehydrogenase